MRFSVLCLLVLGLVPARLSAQIAASPFGASPFGRTPTKRSDASDKAMAALDLAKQAAKDGFGRRVQCTFACREGWLDQRFLRGSETCHRQRASG